ncbi:Uncharacterised protein [Enterococcus cecorum]|nr:Uncharacterised protein [Enterococcus cecorum]
MNDEIEYEYHEKQVNKVITICLEDGNQIKKRKKLLNAKH